MSFRGLSRLLSGQAGVLASLATLWPTLALSAVSTLTTQSGGVEQTVSLARILAVLALGCFLAVGISLLIARHRFALPGNLSALMAGLGRPVDGVQSDLTILASRPLAQGASAHHVRLAGTDWLIVVGTGGVCAVIARPPTAEPPELPQ